MKKYFLFYVFLGLFIFVNNLFAAGTATVNGVSVTIIDDNDVVGFYAPSFISYPVGTSNAYVYNDAGGTSSSAGSLKIRGLTDKSIQFEITNMSDAGTNTIGIFMANGTATPTLWALIYEAVYNGTVTSSGTVTGSVLLSEPHDYGRIGVKRSGTSTADFTIKSTYTRQKR